MSYSFGLRSLARLETVHPHLRRVMSLAIEMTDLDFTVLEGVRTLERQRQLFNAGASRTMRSRHLPHPADGLSRAVDVAPFLGGAVRWDWPLYDRLAVFIKTAATSAGIPLEWGGDWKRFRDGPHWQPPWSDYS
jgi:peptidoglycan L-alanyl-D-glutamate endopeptidase CwlK